MANSKDLSTICGHTVKMKDAYECPLAALYDTTTFVYEKTSDIPNVVTDRKGRDLYQPRITSRFDRRFGSYFRIIEVLHG